MKRTNNILLIVFQIMIISFDNIVAQQNKNIYWPIGTHEYPDSISGYGNSMIRLQSDGVQIDKIDLKMNFEATAAAISDEDGLMLFCTNGCAIVNADGDTIPGSEGLNPGEIADMTCGMDGYINPKGAMFLPWPGQGTKFCLLHMGARYDISRKLTSGPFYYTEIVQNGISYEVTAKNNILLDGDLETFSVIKHGNGRDWWIVVPQYASNKYFVFLLSPTGIQQYVWQTIGPAMSCNRTGSTTFSSDGTRYGRLQNCETLVMDFDRCSGSFSNPKSIYTPEHTFGDGGIAFSPNAQRVFITSQTAILVANLTTLSPVFDTLIHTYGQSDWGVSLGAIQQAPDNNFYISNMARRQYMGLLKMNDTDGSDATYIYNYLDLPVFSVRTSPNDPNYQLYDLPASQCDTLGINGPNVSAAVPANTPRFSLFPDPAVDNVTFSAPTDALLSNCLTIYNINGLEVFRQTLTNGNTDFSVKSWPSGLYFVCLSLEYGPCIWNGKLFVTH